MAKHICGQCSKEFTSEDDYLNHTCDSTGFTPTQPDHLGPEFLAIQKAALERGESRKNPSEKEEVKARLDARQESAPLPVEEPDLPASDPVEEATEEPERLVVEEIPSDNDNKNSDEPSEADILAAVRAARNAKKQ